MYGEGEEDDRLTNHPSPQDALPTLPVGRADGRTVRGCVPPTVAELVGGGRPQSAVGKRGRARARDGAEGGAGGAQEHRAPCTSKQDMFCTSRGTCTRTLMRFGEGTGSSAHSFHVNGRGAPPSSSSELRTLILPPLCLIGFSVVQSPFWINYGTRSRACALPRI